MDRLGREAPLPEAMQGHWVEADDPSSELVVDGGEITCLGQRVDYDYKEVFHQDGAALGLKSPSQKCCDLPDFCNQLSRQGKLRRIKGRCGCRKSCEFCDLRAAPQEVPTLTSQRAAPLRRLIASSRSVRLNGRPCSKP
jgi:hypothetical protein